MKRYCLLKPIATITLFIYLFSSCRKNISDRINVLDTERSLAKEWLIKNGGPFKDETIQVLSPNGKVENGKLDWNKIKKYNYGNRKYTEIPFVFGKNVTVLIGNDATKIGGISFTIVLRKDSLTSYEGAIRYTIYGNIALNNESREKSIITTQSYHLFNGEQSTVWHSTEDNSFKKVIRLTDDEAKAYTKNKFDNIGIGSSSGGVNGKLMMAPMPSDDCYEISSTDYTTICWDDPSLSPGYTVKCTSFPVTTIDLVCNNNSTGGSAGGVSGGTTTGQGSGGGSSWPADDATPIWKKLCGSFKWKVIGAAYNANISSLSVYTVQSNTGISLTAKLNDICVVIPMRYLNINEGNSYSSTQITNIRNGMADNIVRNAWNYAVAEVDGDLNANGGKGRAILINNHVTYINSDWNYTLAMEMYMNKFLTLGMYSGVTMTKNGGCTGIPVTQTNNSFYCNDIDIE